MIVKKTMQAEDLEPSLIQLIIESEKVNPDLANKIKNLHNWIKGKKIGTLRQKKYVVAVLTQLIQDIKVWLTINQLSEEYKEIYFQNLTPVERYWFEFLLPQWFIKEDRYFPCWKQKLMANEYNDDDEPFRNLLSYQIKNAGGHYLWRYLLDLSMATDIIVSYKLSNPLCVQYTKSSPENTLEKKDKWENTLRYWGVTRGLFVCVHPKSKNQGLSEFVNLSLIQSDDLAEYRYIDDNIE